MAEFKPHTFTQDDYEILKREVPYEGKFRMAKYHVRFRLYGGGWSGTMVREVMERKSAAGILPYDPIKDRVILIEQFRPGALSHPQTPWLLEIVAGILEQQEPPESLVIREAQEEANCKILDIHPVCGYFVSPGGCNEYISLFCGRVDAHSDGIFGLHEEHEDIRAFSLPADEAFEMVKENKIQTSPAIVTLQWLQMNRDRLKKLWQTK